MKKRRVGRHYYPKPFALAGLTFVFHLETRATPQDCMKEANRVDSNTYDHNHCCTRSRSHSRSRNLNLNHPRTVSGTRWSMGPMHGAGNSHMQRCAVLLSSIVGLPWLRLP